MDATKNIHQRMLAVMESISFVQKTEKQGFMYKFVTHDAVTALVREQLVKHGIVSTVSVDKHAQDGNRTEVDVIVQLINVDKPEDRVTLYAFGYGIDPQDKGPGKAISYAVKYAYLKAFALETGDDPERDNIDHKKTESAKHAATMVDKERPNTATQVAVDAFAALSPDMQTFISDHARELIGMHEDGKALKPYVEDLALDTEAQLALWAKLPSNVRSAYKKEKTAPAELATQA